MHNWQAQIGIGAGLIGLSGFLPYILTTFQGKTRPNRATWWIWGILGVIQAVSYYYSGANNTIWVPIFYGVCHIVTAILSLKYGEGGWNKLDRLCLFGAGISLLLWWFFNAPFIALIFALVIDFFAALPTMFKSYYAPEQESCFSWSIFLLANTLNLVALEHWSFELLAYPLYLFASTLTISTILYYNQLKKVIVIYRKRKNIKNRRNKNIYD
ncbi:MAG: hypothetical protein ACRC2S_24995 [Waterburya sp.]